MLRIVAALSVVATTALTVVPASAADDPAGPGRMMLVLDSSGSMAEKTSDGTARIDAAKDALERVIDDLPEGQDVGLRVYGAKVFDRKQEGACTDSQVIVKPGTGNRDRLTGALGDYKPYGETPIGYALQEAGKDLGDEGRRTIVLVSDGEPTCDPDPCKVAADLAKGGIDVRIDVVGLDVSGSARDKLRCIADAGHGTYYDADSADELVSSLDTSTTRASRPFDLTGEPVEGTATPADAPTIGQGVHLDTIPLNDGLWYKIERTEPNSTLHVGVAHRSTAIGNFGQWANVAIYHDPEQLRCDDAISFPRGSIGFTGVQSWNKDPEDLCNTATTLYVHVERNHDTDDRMVGTPVEVAVYEEPPLSDPTGRGLSSVPDEPAWQTIEPGEPKDGVVPGTSINNAPVVEDGTYAFDINPGETQVVAVPLDWGQNLQAQFDGALTREFLGKPYDEADVSILGPAREETAIDFYGDEPADWSQWAGTLFDDMVGNRRSGAQTYTLAYLNRSDVNDAVSGASTPGLRYVQVSYPKKSSVPMAYTLTVKTNGTAGEGAPKYADVDGLVAPTADSALVTGTSSASEGAAQKVRRDDADGGIAWLPVGLGVGGVVLLAGAALVVRRSRASQRQ